MHIGDELSEAKLNVTAASLPPNESELELAGLTAVPSESVGVPGIAEAKIRMECVLERAIPLGGTPDSPAADLLIGRVVRFHVDDVVLDRGRILADVLRPVSRLAGNDYAKLGETFSLERPKYGTAEVIFCECLSVRLIFAEKAGYNEEGNSC